MLSALGDTETLLCAGRSGEAESKPAHRLKGTFSPGRLGGHGRRHCASDTSGGTRAEMEGKGTGPRSPEVATSKGNSRPRSQWQAGEPCLPGWVGGWVGAGAGPPHLGAGEAAARALRSNLRTGGGRNARKALRVPSPAPRADRGGWGGDCGAASAAQPCPRDRGATCSPRPS